ncbi:MAG: TIGR00266 family protein [Anaerolineales bacterium]|nr:TIGR00266 family protein [Anaerolineales bacterium]
MKYSVEFQPSYSLAVVELEPNEKVIAEAGAMVSMSTGTQVETNARGGILNSLGRSLLGGESFFQNTFTAGASGGEITLAPVLPGDIVGVEMKNRDLFIQAGSFLACEYDIQLNTKLSSKSLFSGEGVSILQATGTGTILISSYGAIFKKTLTSDEKYIVDTQHLVAWDTSLGVMTKTVGGLKSTIFSGEGLVVELQGPGDIYIQTRSPNAFIQWIIPKIPKTNNG